MINTTKITDDIINEYEHPRFILKIGNTVITEDDIGSGSLSMRGGTSQSNVFEPGGAVITSLSFVLLNYEGKYTNLDLSEGTHVDVYVGYGKDITADYSNYMKKAVVYVCETTKNRNTISITCYDGLRKADKTKWVASAETMTVNQIIQSVCQRAAITIETLPTYGGDIQVSGLNTQTESMTCRQALSEALLISGNFGYMNNEGKLVCKWFDFGNTTKSYTDYFDGTLKNIKIYTGVQVSDVVVGQTDALYKISSNTFITDDNKNQVANRIYDAICGKHFYAGSVGVLADPRIEQGDIITVPFRHSDEVYVFDLPVTGFNLKGSLIETFECDAETEDEIDDLREKESEAGGVSESEVERIVEEKSIVSGIYSMMDDGDAIADATKINNWKMYLITTRVTPGKQSEDGWHELQLVGPAIPTVGIYKYYRKIKSFDITDIVNCAGNCRIVSVYLSPGYSSYTASQFLITADLQYNLSSNWKTILNIYQFAQNTGGTDREYLHFDSVSVLLAVSEDL